MPKIGTIARVGTLHGGGFNTPGASILIAYGKVAAFKTDYHLWSNGGNDRMLKKAQEGRLDVRVFVSPTDWIIEDYNEGYDEDFFVDVNVVVDGWCADIHGLIYTDETFEKEIQRLLGEFNIPNDVYYTEQGMQGDNYVSMSGNADFFNWFVITYGAKKFGFDIEKRKAILAEAKNDIDRVIAELKNIKVGARRINDTWRGHATLVYSKKIVDVTKGLRSHGWKRLDKKRNSAKMRKDNMTVDITKSTRYNGPRIYIKGEWS